MKINSKILLLAKAVITLSLLVLTAMIINPAFNEARKRVSFFLSRENFYKEHDRIAAKAKMNALNTNIPVSFDYLVGLSNNRHPDAEEIKGYLRYYKKVIDYIPDQPEAYGILGYCYFYMGEKEKAVDSYRQAIKMNPSFFWFYYDLGVIYFSQGRFHKAAGMLQKAVTSDINMTLAAIASSKIYTQLRLSLKGFDEDIMLHLKSGYQDSLRLLALSYYNSGDYSGMLASAAVGIKRTQDKTGDFSYLAGLAQYELKKYKEAVSSFRVCLTKNNRNIKALEYMGLSLEAFAKAQMSNPENEVNTTIGREDAVKPAANIPPLYIF